jgi:hypothetical protein
MTIHRPDHPQGLLNNSVVVINCMPKAEMQTARSISDGLRDLQYETISRRIFYFDDVGGRDQFLEIIRMHAKKYPDFEPFPIIHVDAHGDEKRGLEVAPDQFVSWQELFSEFQAINKATDNNLGVVLAACHGIELSDLVKVLQPSPFNFLVSARGEVSAGATKMAMLAFYSALFRDMAVQRAFTSLGSDFDFFYSRNFFVVEWAFYCRKYWLGKGREKTVEKQLTDAMALPLAARYLGVKKVRRALKDGLKFDRRYFEEKSRTFFHGRVPIDFDDFMYYVRHNRFRDAN